MAAFEVGYESLRQFSREYKRQFGNTPKKDIQELKERLCKTNELVLRSLARLRNLER